MGILLTGERCCMAIEKALIVDGEAALRNYLTETLKRKKIDISSTENGHLAMAALKNQAFDLLLCNIKLADISGIELLKHAKTIHPHLIVILIIEDRNIENGIEAIRHGAFNYLIQPFSSETLEALIDKANEHAALLKENHYLKQEISSQVSGKREQMIAESSVMKQILQDVSKIAKSNASVFISGESGTGKEVIAHAIHHLSQRASHPFIKVNCAAIPESLIESEFFGHEKGSFTGAINRRLGRFELADKGTLLLDEISEIPLSLQSKLLRAVQEQEFERVGGVRPISVDVRLISTSNRNMKDAIDQKIFREDLYYRLNVMPIDLPPLRERKEDILPLAEYFLERLCIENHKIRKRMSQDARKKLLEYHWPGNIRELANIVERTVVMDSSDIILPEHLCIDPFLCKIKEASSGNLSLGAGMTLDELEKKHILETLASHNYNRTKAAKMLGISIRTLRNKLNEYKETISKE
jgi:two-component system, NtrC family, response regulator AtoC